MYDLDDEGEDDDLRVAASHLNKDLPGNEECQEAREEERDFQHKRPSLEALLGPLPTAASLGLSDSISKCVGEEKENENGEERRLRTCASRSARFNSLFSVTSLCFVIVLRRV